MFKNKKKKIKEECWNIDYSFIQWLRPRLEIFKEDAGKVIDLEFHKFEYKDIEYSQLELLDRMIELSTYLEDHYYDCEPEIITMTYELLDLFSLTFRSLWW